MPESWGNSGNGGIRFTNDGFVAYSGKRHVEKGETLFFDFELLFTIPEFVYEKLDKNKFFKIGKVTNKPFSKNSCICIEYKKNIFKHFEE